MNKKALAIGAVVAGGAYLYLSKEAEAKSTEKSDDIPIPDRGTAERFDVSIGTGTVANSEDGFVVTKLDDSDSTLIEPGFEMEYPDGHIEYSTADGKPLTQEELARRLQDAAAWNPDMVF